jgi:hypothetical protein
MVPVETALRITLFESRFTSTRMWPSMRVTGSTTTRLPELSTCKSLGFVCAHVSLPHSSLPGLLRDCLMALTAACATTAAPTTPAAPMPILSAFDSTPKALISVTRS